MKFSLTTSFAKLAFLSLLAVFLLSIGGRLVAAQGSLEACAGWPLCVPQGAVGWALLFHRISVVGAVILMLSLLFYAWKTQRDHRLLLPLTTATVILFFAQAFTGAILSTRDFAPVYQVFHSLTALALWVSLLGLVAAAGYLAKDAVAFPPLDVVQRLKDFLTLTKPIIVALLLVTTFAGLVAGGKTWPSFPLTFWTLLGGALAAGGSGAINQYIDRDLDKNMQRTSRRPMAAGRMMPAEGLAFGLALCIISFYLMAGFVNFLAAFLSLAGIFYYVVLYSILLKKATVQNIVIGGGAGAIPPLVGWAAATGRLDIPALFLFAIVFMWTPPHFWALALVRRNEYARAGVPMLPVVRGETETRKQVLIYTILLVTLSLSMSVFHFAGIVYLVSALALGGGLLYAAWRVYRLESNKAAWQMYRYSSMYLMLLFLALVVDALV
ncbi:MAG: heme o synthase [Anaerolineales bacterium]